MTAQDGNITLSAIDNPTIIANAGGVGLAVALGENGLGVSFGVAAAVNDEEDPVKVERDLMRAVPKSEWIWFGHAMIWLGRRVCKARAPDCPDCVLKKVCPKRGV